MIIHFKGILLFILGIFFLPSQPINGQVYLQLEIYGDPKPIKLLPGIKLKYKTTDSDGEWNVDRIESVRYNENLIVFRRGYVNLEDITHIKLNKEWVGQLGAKMMQFSYAWFLFGGIAHYYPNDWRFGWDSAGIGGGAFLTGFVLKKLGASKTYNVKKNDRLRIIDETWPDPK